MVNTILVQLLVLLFSLGLHAKVDRIHTEVYLGEKNLTSYSERYQPLVLHDIYQGKITFSDDAFFQNFFQPYLFQKEQDYSFFLKSELNGGMMCSNELLAEHFDEIRFSYRLITLSYFLEGQWHLKLMSDHFLLKNGCEFDLNSWLATCSPKSIEMKKFVDRLQHYMPRYDEYLDPQYKVDKWFNEFKTGKYVWPSHYRLKQTCGDNCQEKKLNTTFNKACSEDQKLMTMLCSETDEIYGLSLNRQAYSLIGSSNIINTYNKQGEAMGCLRRFSEVMSHKEVRYEVLKTLFPSLQTFLQQKYQERFAQGRVFFFGSGKEFEDKGLKELYVKEQPLKVAKNSDPPGPEVNETPRKVTEAPLVKPAPVAEAPRPKSEPLKEINKQMKSAFYQAAELRKSQDMDRVEVDMLKFKYDYIFTLNMINTLSVRLKTFMTREALAEMMSYDKLGTKEGAVPLVFIKYMIDMEEHHGLWNILSVLGDKFYVSNEIDAALNPEIQLIQLSNREATGNQWQIYILKP